MPYRYGRSEFLIFFFYPFLGATPNAYHSYMHNQMHAPGGLSVAKLTKLIQQLNFVNRAEWNGTVRIFSCQTGKKGPGSHDYILELLSEIRNRQLPQAQSVFGSTVNVQHVPIAPPIIDRTLRIASATSTLGSTSYHVTKPGKEISCSDINLLIKKQIAQPSFIPTSIKRRIIADLKTKCISKHQYMNNLFPLNNRVTETLAFNDNSVNAKLKEFEIIKNSAAYINKALKSFLITNTSQIPEIEINIYIDSLSRLLHQIKSIKVALRKLNTELQNLLAAALIREQRHTPIQSIMDPREENVLPHLEVRHTRSITRQPSQVPSMGLPRL